MRLLENPFLTYLRTTNNFRIHKTARSESVRLWPLPLKYLPRDPKSYLSIDESDDEYTIPYSTVLNAPPSNPYLELAKDFLPPPELETADQEANFRAEAKALGSKHAREQMRTKRPFDVVDASNDGEEERNKKAKMSDDRERMEEEADAESNWVERQWYAEQTTAVLNAFLETLGYYGQGGRPKGKVIKKKLMDWSVVLNVAAFTKEIPKSVIEATEKRLWAIYGRQKSISVHDRMNIVLAEEEKASAYHWVPLEDSIFSADNPMYALEKRMRNVLNRKLKKRKGVPQRRPPAKNDKIKNGGSKGVSKEMSSGSGSGGGSEEESKEESEEESKEESEKESEEESEKESGEESEKESGESEKESGESEEESGESEEESGESEEESEESEEESEGESKEESKEESKKEPEAESKEKSEEESEEEESEEEESEEEESEEESEESGDKKSEGKSEEESEEGSDGESEEESEGDPNTRTFTGVMGSGTLRP